MLTNPINHGIINTDKRVPVFLYQNTTAVNRAEYPNRTSLVNLIDCFLLEDYMPKGFYKSSGLPMSPPINNRKGYKHSKKSRENMSISHLGKSHPHTEEWNKNIGISHLGKKCSPETCRRISIAKSNMSEETRKKMSISRKLKVGNKSPAWKGGITPLMKNVRTTIEYKKWRGLIFTRDNYTCRKCGIKNGMGETVKIHAHHIIRACNLRDAAIKQSPLLKEFEAVMIYRPMWNIDNGITLCRKCHYDIGKGENYGNFNEV